VAEDLTEATASKPAAKKPAKKPASARTRKPTAS
jgi:hypothetical protein